MAFMSLRESLSSSKAKWKERLRLAQSPATSPPSTPAAPTTTRPGQGRVGLSGIKPLLEGLESAAEAFGPLASVVSGLNKCVEAYEASYKCHQDYKELKRELEELLNDMTKHILVTNPMGPLMTNSVKRLCTDLELELKLVEEKQARSTARRLMEALDAPDDILDCYRRIHAHLQRLALNANLSMLYGNMKILKFLDEEKMEARLTRLLPSMSAIYNSAEKDEIGRDACTLGTREDEISLLLEWSQDPEAGRTCWMNGMAGTGKTTIAYSVCANLEGNFKLGASFFCSRTIPECRQVKRIIPTIAYQLARFSLPFRCALVTSLETDPDVHTRAVELQYQKLIIDPLLKVQGSIPVDFIVVIDALDECENENTVGQILDLLLSPKFDLPIRYLVSSRPEIEIVRRMTTRKDEMSEVRLVLHELNADTVKADIKTYMEQQLAHIPLSNIQWSRLVDRCGVLFIYASTTCRYIKQSHDMHNLNEAMRTIERSSAKPEDNHEYAIDGLYLAILDAAFNKPGLSRTSKQRMQAIIETTICTAEPITLSTLAEMLCLENAEQAGGLLQPLRSVLNVQANTGLVTTLHASFPDFMFSRDRSKSFHCNQETRHASLFKECMRMIDRAEPKFNICRLPSSYLFDEEVKDLGERVAKAITPGLLYACRYWSTHLTLGEYREEMVDRVQHFLMAQFLLWMEVLNLTKCMRHGTSIIVEAKKWCSKYRVPADIATLIHDAWQFVSIYANHAVSRSTPHIYTSMLPFWPQSRPISVAYMPKTAGMMKATGTGITGRQLSLLATWKVSEEVHSMSLSSDGSRLAANIGRTIEILDTSTGNSLHSLTPEDIVLSIHISSNGTRVLFRFWDSSVYLWEADSGGKVTDLISAQVSDVSSSAFSPDFSRVAFGCGNGDVYICSLQERHLVQGPFKGHTETVSSLAFSPNGLYLASGSFDKTVRIWDVVTGDMVGNPLEGHSSLVKPVSYSSDGSFLVSTSWNNIRVWDLQTRQTVLGPLGGHSRLLSATFSPNGRFIATGSEDRTIRVYDAQTGRTALGPFHGHTDYVSSVTFSPDSARLFSCSYDGTIRIWNVQDTHVPDVPQNTPPFSSSFSSIRYSHSGSLIVSGSADGSVHIWDVKTGEMVLGPLRTHDGCIFSVDYSPNDTYIASASEHGTLRIWDMSNGQDLHGPMHGHSSWIGCVRFSPDTSLVASGSDDGTVRIWDVTTGQPVMKLLEENEDGIRSVGFSPDGQHLVCGSSKGILQMMDRHTSQAVVGPLQAHEYAVSSVEFSPDGSRILSGSLDKSIRIWDVQTGQQILGPNEHTLRHDSSVQSAAFSPDGQLIVSCSTDRTIRVWDSQSGNLVFGPLEGHTDWVTDVQFAPDGSHLVSCSDDRSIRFWDVSSCRREMQETGEQVEMDVPSECVDKTYGLWTLDSDGWVVDQRNRRLVWVPSDLHESLMRAYNDSLITDEPWVKLESDEAKIGEEWMECYRPRDGNYETDCI